ncbi:MAG TPA: delta-60 repeat domain-containing protein, partial [Polyangiaceae bacterium]
MFITKAIRFLSPFGLVLLAACSVKTEASKPEPTPMEEPEPGDAAFELRVTGTKVPVIQGTSAEVRVQVVRKGTFDGAVHVAAENLPEGATLEPATIGADEDEITLAIRAAGEAPHSLPTAVELVGTAEELESSVELTVTVCGHPGALDTSFLGGRTVVPIGAGDDYANALAVTGEGKILVAGSAAENRGDIALLRLERDGRLDTSFGEDGKVFTSLGDGSDVARAIAIQSDGKIVVAGATTGADTGLDFAVVRYLPDGSLDSSFGDGGKASVSLSDDTDGAYALLLQKDGKIVAAGAANQGSGTTGVDFALVRWNADGSLDESFGEDGSVVTPIGSNAASDTVYALASQEVGGEERLIAAGGEGDFALARYTADGELDASFGEGGSVSGVFGSVIGAARALRVTDGGRVLVAGHHSHDF